MNTSFISLLNTVAQLRTDKSGVTAIEYGLIMGAIAIAITVSVEAVGMELGTVLGTIAQTIETVTKGD
jgi:Flp pilus assembly pilin Flp